MRSFRLLALPLLLAPTLVLAQDPAPAPRQPYPQLAGKYETLQSLAQIAFRNQQELITLVYTELHERDKTIQACQEQVKGLAAQQGKAAPAPSPAAPGEGGK